MSSPTVSESGSSSAIVSTPSGSNLSSPKAPKAVQFRTYLSDTFNRLTANAAQLFPGNMITTSKYTLWSFLPVCIFEQFRRIANFYFLIIIILMLIPGVSPFPIYTSVIPLVVILTVTAVKEAREDYLRHQQDYHANNSKFYVLQFEESLRKVAGPRRTNRTSVANSSAMERQHSYSANSVSMSQSSFSRSSVAASVVVNSDIKLPRAPAGCKWTLKPSRDIIVGDVICILESQEFPSDIVAFSSARPDNNCYINTANLDGEAVPKLRRTLDANCWFGELQCPEPSTNMSSFNAVAKLFNPAIINDRVRNLEISTDNIANMAQIEEFSKKQHPELANDPQELANTYMKTSSLTISNLLMRGASLANTAWIVGSVCYTGPDTKMMMNRAPAKVKFSNFEQMLNRFIWGILLINFIICFCLSIASVRGDQTWSKVYNIDSDGFVQWIKNFCTLYVLFSWMLPISLYVTIELVRVFQSLCMELDVGFKLVIQVPDMDGKESEAVTGEDGEENVHLGYTEVTRMLKVNNSSLIEEFGHVNYIFTDKTGTLTYNQMELAAITVDHNTYMHEIQREGADSNKNQQPATGIRAMPNKGTVNKLIDLTASQLPVKIVAEHHKDNIKTLTHGVSSTAIMFFLNILLNNDVNPSHRGQDLGKGWTFMSQSPDEVALCEALRDCGMLLINKTQEKASILLSTDIINQIENNLKNGGKSKEPLPSPRGDRVGSLPPSRGKINKLKNHDSDEESDSSELIEPANANKKKIGFEVLNLFAKNGNGELDSDEESEISEAPAKDNEIEPSFTKNLAIVPEEAMLYYNINAMLDFTSARRRSTIIATCPVTNVYYMLTKGADSTILPMCKESAVLNETKKVMREMSSTGARTLVLAGKVLSKAEYNDFMGKYKEITEGMSADRDQEIEDLFTSFEKHLDCLGASAVLDQIQDGARNTVEKLLEAGIGVTVVTGDKRETAVSIGKESAIVPTVSDLIFTYEQLPEFVSIRNVSSNTINRDDSDPQWQQYLTKLRSAKLGKAPGAFMGRKDKDKLGTPGHVCTNNMCFRVCTGETNLYFCGENAHLIVDNIEYKVSAAHFSKVGQKYTCMDMPPEEEEVHSVHKWAAEDIIQKAVIARNNGGYNLDTKFTFAVEKGGDMTEDWFKVPIEVCSAEARQVIKALTSFYSVYRCAHAACGLPSLDSAVGPSNGGNVEMGKLAKDTNPLYTVERSDVSLPVSVCISGDFMEIALTQHTPLGMMLLSNVKSVVAYRCAPRQKQLIVAAVKNQGNVCIAIGDGANDVSMIQESSIGVGILGKEGAHAALSSDMVVYRFHHLQRLVLYHGRYNFHRNGLIVLLAFYKNFAFVLPVVWYSFMNKFSGQILTLSYFMSVYNLFFTSLPLFSLGLLDMDIPGIFAIRIPLAYKKFQSENDFHLLGLLKWLVLATIQSLITFFLLIFGMYREGVDTEGRTFDLWGPGNMSTLAVVILINVILLFDCLAITWVNILFCVLGILSYFCVYALFTFGNLTNMAPEGFGVLQGTFSVPKMWLFTLCVVGAGLVPYIAWRSYRMLFPTYAGRIREHATEQNKL